MSASACFFAGSSTNIQCQPWLFEPVGACIGDLQALLDDRPLDRPVEVEALADGAGGREHFVGGEVEVHRPEYVSAVPR